MFVSLLPLIFTGLRLIVIIKVILLLDSASRAKMDPYEFSTFNLYSPLSDALQALPEEKRQWNPVRKDGAHLCFTDEVVDSILSSSSPLVFEEIISFLTDLVLPRWRTASDKLGFDTTIPWPIFYKTVQQMYNLLNSNFHMHMTKTMSTASHHKITQQMLWIDLLNGIKGLTKLRRWAKMADRTVKVTTDSDDDESDSDVDEDDYDNYSRRTGRSIVHVRGGDLDVETKQSINRVTYLGGVLLPFSIVAAIFSMGDTYSPGGSHFFIFWVIAIPICCITTAVIYADSIRRMTVEQFASQYGAIIEEDKIDEVTDSATVSVVDSEEKVKPASRWNKFSRLGRLLHFSWRLGDSNSITDSEHSSTGSSGSLSSIRSTTTGEEPLARPVVPPTHPEDPEQKKKKQSRWRLRFRRASSLSEPDLEHGTTITIGHDSNEKPGAADTIIVTNPEPIAPVRLSSPAHEPTSPSPAPEPEPTSPVCKPTSPTFEPTSPVYEPTSPVYEPTSPTFEPTSPTFEPTSPTFEPSSPTFEPSSPTFEPSSPTFEPSSPTFEPSSPTFEPSSPISELVGSTPNPVADGEPSVPHPITVVPTPGTDNKPARSPLSIHIPPSRYGADAADVPLPPSPSDEDFQRNEETKARTRKEQSLKEAEERALRERETAIDEADRKVEEVKDARKAAYRQAEEEELARRAAAEAEYTRRQDELNARHRDEIERRRAEEEKEVIVKERAELERRRRAIEDELEAKKQAEMEERRLKDLKGKGREEASNDTSTKAPIKFKDAVGRKFTFPFELVKTWDVRSPPNYFPLLNVPG
jgi:hypothetical protein